MKAQLPVKRKSTCPSCEQEAEEWTTLENTLEEGWYIAIEDGKFSFIYQCSCTECGYWFTHEYEEVL